MNKLFALASMTLAMLLAACGDNGVRSPEFDSRLIDIIVEGPPQAQVGQFAQMRALGHFTEPPSAAGQSTQDITSDVDWDVVVPNTTSGSTPEIACLASNTPAHDIATVNNVGLVHALAIGTVYVKATQKGGSIAGCRPFTVVPCTGNNCSGGGGDSTLTGIVIQPHTATTAVGSDTPAYKVLGTYANPPSPRDLDSGTTVVWSSANTGIATVNVQQGDSRFATAHGVSAGTTTLTASTAAAGGGTLTDTATVTVNPATVKSVLRVEPPTATVVIGFSQPFVACGTFSDGSTDPDGQPCSAHPTTTRTETAGRAIPTADLNWTSSDQTIADNPVADPNSAIQVLATGKAEGTTTIAATLKDTVGDPAPAQRSATAVLTVNKGPLCKPASGTTPSAYLLASGGAVVSTGQGSLCLACSVDNKDAIVDAEPADPSNPTAVANDTFAQMNASLSALDLLGQGYLSVKVTVPAVIDSTATATNTADPVGFIIGRPVNDLLTAEVLAQTQIKTYLGSSASPQETFSPAQGTDSLVLVPLGLAVSSPGISETERFFLHSDRITKPFDAIELVFSPAAASVLSTLDVFNACSDVEVAPTPPAP